MFYTLLGGRVYSDHVRYDHENTRLRINPGTEGYTTIDDDIELRDDYPSFHMLKLVSDTSTRETVKVILDDAIYDTSGHSLYGGLFAGNDYTVIHVATAARLAAPCSMYVGAVILTENEP